MILVVGGIKGGSGKTTLAVNLAVLRAYGHKVLLIDADEQNTATTWSFIRKRSTQRINQFDSIKLIGRSIYKDIQPLISQYDDIIIDTGGRDTESQRSVLTISDKYLVPFKPKSFDVWTIRDVSELHKQILTVNPKIKAYTVINQADHRGHDNNDTKDILKGFNDFSFIDIPICNRKAFSNASDDGLGVIELPKQDEKANSEINALYKEIYK